MQVFTMARAREATGAASFESRTPREAALFQRATASVCRADGALVGQDAAQRLSVMKASCSAFVGPVVSRPVGVGCLTVIDSALCYCVGTGPGWVMRI
jgi:hypothetical protein